MSHLYMVLVDHIWLTIYIWSWLTVGMWTSHLISCCHSSVQDWVAHFFKGEMPKYDEQVMIVQPPIYSVASRTTSTIHVTFTYDESVNFVTNEGTFVM